MTDGGKLLCLLGSISDVDPMAVGISIVVDALDEYRRAGLRSSAAAPAARLDARRVDMARSVYPLPTTGLRWFRNRGVLTRVTGDRELQMTNEKPYLTVVNSGYDVGDSEEFIPLPFYAWDERPAALALDYDECATAIHLAAGDVPAAARFLKVALYRLHRVLSRNLRLQRVLMEAQALAVSRASSEYLRALDSLDDRRREWGATRIMQSRAAMGHAFSPAPASSSQSSASFTLSGPQRLITFRWRTPEDLPAIDSDEAG